MITNKDEEIDLVAVMVLLWRRKWTIVLFALLGIFSGLGLFLITPPTYQANALVQIENASQALAVPKGFSDIMGSNANSSTAEMELLHARLTLATAVKKMRLDWVAKPIRFPVIGHAVTKLNIPLPDWQPLNRYARTNESITLSFLKVPQAWLGLEIELVHKGDDEFSITLPDRSILNGKVGSPLANKDGTFATTIEHIQGDKGRAFILQQLSELSAVENLTRSMADVEQGKNTGVIRLTFNGPDPELNRRTLDAIFKLSMAKTSRAAQPKQRRA